MKPTREIRRGPRVDFLQVVTWGDTSSGADSRRVKEQLENCRDLSCPGLFTREKLYVLTVPCVFFLVFFSAFSECLIESIRINIEIILSFQACPFERCLECESREWRFQRILRWGTFAEKKVNR